LSAHLDRGDTSLVQPMGAALDSFPMEIILMSVRKYVQIDRLVRFDLDEDPVFSKMLYRINKVAN